MNKYFRNKNIKNKVIKKIKIRLILILKNIQNLKMISKMTINQLKKMKIALLIKTKIK